MLRWFGGSVVILAGLAASCASAQPGAPYGDWSGPYAGVAVGADFGHAKWTARSTSDLPGNIVDASSPRTYDPAGLRGSLVGGYDWRRGRWVFGPQVEIGLANARKTAAGFPGCTVECAGSPGPGVDTTSVDFRWDAGVRARLGYLVTPDVLLYAAGGAAWQNIRVSGRCQASLPDPQCLVAPGDPFMSEARARTVSGGTVGGGVEWRVSGPWRVVVDYRRLMLNARTDAFFVGQPSFEPGASTYRFRIAPTADVVTVGLTLHY